MEAIPPDSMLGLRRRRRRSDGVNDDHVLAPAHAHAHAHAHTHDLGGQQGETEIDANADGSLLAGPTAGNRSLHQNQNRTDDVGGNNVDGIARDEGAGIGVDVDVDVDVDTIDDENSIIDDGSHHRREQQQQQQLWPNIMHDRPWKLSHVYCLASTFMVLLAILAAPVPNSPHMGGLMKDLRHTHTASSTRKNLAAVSGAPAKAEAKTKAKDLIKDIESNLDLKLWTLEDVATAAAISVKSNKKQKESLKSELNKQAEKAETAVEMVPLAKKGLSTHQPSSNPNPNPNPQQMYDRIQQALYQSSSPADAFHALNQIALGFGLVPASDTSAGDEKESVASIQLEKPIGRSRQIDTKKVSVWLRWFMKQDAYALGMAPLGEKMIIPPSDVVNGDATVSQLQDREGLAAEPTGEARSVKQSWFQSNVLESPYFKWIDPTILRPSPSTPTDIVNKIISSRPRLVAIANLFLSLTYLLHALVAGWFLGTIFNRSSIRRGENAVIMGGGANAPENNNINPEGQPPGLVIDWTGAAGVRERMAGFLIFKMLLMAQVVEIPENFSYLILLTWYTCLSCLRSWDHLCHASTMHTTASGQPPNRGVLQLLLLALFLDIIAASSCVGLFHSIGFSMVVLLTCDCALLAVDITGHLLKHFMCVMEYAHGDVVSQLQARQLLLHQQRRRRIGMSRNSNYDDVNDVGEDIGANDDDDNDIDRRIESLEFAHSRRLSFLDTAIFTLQVVHDVITVSHFLHIWHLHGVQFTLIDGVLALHLHSAISSACRKIAQRRNINSIARDLDNLFPDASEMELRKADVCCICLGHMSNSNGQVKKVRCGHVFHSNCLREVVERAPSIREAKCPLCRGSLLDGSCLSTTELETPAPIQPQQQPIAQQPPAAAAVANERALFRFTTEHIVPAWLPIPAFSFEVVRRPPPSAVIPSDVNNNNSNDDGNNNERGLIPQAQLTDPSSQEPESNSTANDGGDENGTNNQRDAVNSNANNEENSPSILRRILVLAGAVPMSPEEEMRALTHLVDMFPQYDRQDLLRALRERGSAEAVVESVLMGTFSGTAR